MTGLGGRIPAVWMAALNGIRIRCDLEPFPEIGDILKVHSMVFPDAPIKSVIVRRIAEAGVIGVEFMLI